MNWINYIKEAINKWWSYLLSNKDKIQSIVDLLEDEANLSDKKIIDYAKIILDNLSNIEKKRIYRWVSVSYIREKNTRKIDNYVNSKHEALLYWQDLVLEYEYNYTESNVIEEHIKLRKENVRQYDEEILKNIRGYKWYIWSWIYHYRLRNSLLKLKKIYYLSNNPIENISKLVEVTRLYLWLSQKEFADKLWIKQSKISEYENGKRDIWIDMLTKISRLVNLEQSIKVNNNLISVK